MEASGASAHTRLATDLASSITCAMQENPVDAGGGGMMVPPSFPFDVVPQRRFRRPKGGKQGEVIKLHENITFRNGEWRIPK